MNNYAQNWIRLGSLVQDRLKDAQWVTTVRTPTRNEKTGIALFVNAGSSFSSRFSSRIHPIQARDARSCIFPEGSP